MKLTRTAWNNVIIFTVMAMIILINVTNKQLFSDHPAEDIDPNGYSFLLAKQAVILTVTINDNILIERLGQSWQMSPKLLEPTELEKMMLAWQQSTALLQAAEIEIQGNEGTVVAVYLAGQEQTQTFTLYRLSDQLLIQDHHHNRWLSMPASAEYRLLPEQLTSK